MSKAKKPFEPQNFKEVFMPFSQSVYMTVVVLNGDTVRARGREGCCGGGRINFLTDVPKTISSLRDIQGLQMDVPTAVCVCVWGGGISLLPSKRFSSFWHNLRETLTTCVFPGEIYVYFTKTFGMYQVNYVIYLYL